MPMSGSSLVRLARLLLAVALLLAATLSSAPVARAAALVVDRGDDLPGLACTAAPNDCSLRSAVDAANANGAVADQISFTASYTINLTRTIQLTADNTTIAANVSQTIQVNGSGITIGAGSSSGSVFVITGSGVKLEGLAIYGALAGWPNIAIVGTAQRVSIANNVIGDDDDIVGGCGQSPSSSYGIYISATGTVASDSARVWIYGNIIECNQGQVGNANNPGDGITIVNTNAVLLGVNESDASTIAERNFISNNRRNGVTLVGTSGSNQILNTFIFNNGNSGVVLDDANGTVIARCFIQINSNSGIEVINGTRNTRIGSPLGGPLTDGNLIAGNTNEGIYVAGSTTQITFIFGNYIGINGDGFTASGNGRYGIRITNGASSTIVGVTANERNLIAGNGYSGVMIDSLATNNTVQGNHIGTDATGTRAVPNGNAAINIGNRSGVVLSSAAQNNTIGGTTASNGNLISGNAGSGVYISGGATSDNLIDGNTIGTNAARTAALGNGDAGIRLIGADANTLGHNSQSNSQLISGNVGAGIEIELTNGTRILSSNYIGYSSIGNGREGILLTRASNTVITPYAVMYNGGAGIAITDPSSVNNTILFTENHSNRGLAIDLGNDGLTPNDSGDADSGPNTLLNYPQITGVSGTFVSGTACPGCSVFVYQAYGSVGMPYGGGGLLGIATANGIGGWSVSVPEGYTRLMLTAILGSGNNTSEMTPRPQTYLPLGAK